MNRQLRTVGCTLLLGFLAACSSETPNTNSTVATNTTNTAATATPAASPDQSAVGLHPNHKPHSTVIAKGRVPKPPANAKKATSIGKGKLAANTGNGSGDTDSFWVEELDIDGDGKVEQTYLLYDDEDKVLYFYAEKDFPCKSGSGTGRGGVLMAVYGAGNKRGKPIGSSWYTAELDAGECNAKAAALWGCKFDAKGNPTECGGAEARMVEEDDIAIVEPAPSAPTTGNTSASPKTAANSNANSKTNVSSSPSPKATATVKP